MIPSSSSSLSLKILCLMLILLLFQYHDQQQSSILFPVVVDAADALHHTDSEKIFSSIVYIVASGKSSSNNNDEIGFNEKAILEETFESAYRNIILGDTSSIIPTACSLRSLYDVTLMEEEVNSVEDEVILKFGLKLKCYDCPDSGVKIFNNDNFDLIITANDNYERAKESNKKNDEHDNFYSAHYSADIFGIDNNKNRRILEENNDDDYHHDGCIWSNYKNKSPSTRMKNNAPTKSNFIYEFNEILATKRTTRVVEDLQYIERETTIEMSQLEQPLSCPCPMNSYCSYTNTMVDGVDRFWKVSDFDDLYHNCTCRDGFRGDDGWRCDMVDECLIEGADETWPCAPKEEGGICVDTHPDNEDDPKYKCGCGAGYIPNENFPIDDIHGIMHCLKLKDDNWCNKERNFPAVVLSLDVTGNPDAIISERTLIEETVKIAYEKSISKDATSCQTRYLDDVTFFKIKKSSGQYVDTLREEQSRYLMNEENEDERMLEIEDDDDYFAPTSSIIIQDEDDDYVYTNTSDVGFNINLNFNFSIFFAMILRCYGCPKNAQLFDDASRRRRRRRLLQQRQLDDEEYQGTCDCSQYEDEEDESFERRNRNLHFLRQEDLYSMPSSSSSSMSSSFMQEEVNNDDDALPHTRRRRRKRKLQDNIFSSESSPSSLLSSVQETFVQTFNEVLEEKEVEAVTGANAVEDKTIYKTEEEEEEDTTPIDPCENNVCTDDATCVDLEFNGLYDCSCNTGYQGDGRTVCRDINECASRRTNTCTDICINTIGSYRCIYTPSASPSAAPTLTLSAMPSTTPSVMPSAKPTSSPTESPTRTPTILATGNPTSAPTSTPTSSPTSTPTSVPTSSPTFAPTFGPTSAPTFAPTSGPTSAPTSHPTSAPTFAPTSAPTAAPTFAPTHAPTSAPTFAPTYAPTFPPTFAPTHTPTLVPSSSPTKQVEGYYKKYSGKYPHCTHIGNTNGCFNFVSRDFMRQKCNSYPTCTGFTYSSGIKYNGWGCIKACGNEEFGGFGGDSHDYWAKL